MVRTYGVHVDGRVAYVKVVSVEVSIGRRILPRVSRQLVAVAVRKKHDNLRQTNLDDLKNLVTVTSSR